MVVVVGVVVVRNGADTAWWDDRVKEELPRRECVREGEVGCHVGDTGARMRGVRLRVDGGDDVGGEC